MEISAYLNALGADLYDIRMICSKSERPAQKRKFTPEILRKSLKYLSLMNAKGFHIYARPVGYRYIFIDDVSADNLPALAKLKPCILIESSPSNFQAWLKLSTVPKDRETAATICRYAAYVTNADKGSAEPDHLGRLPGFRNCKPKYQSAAGFPLVRLRKYSERFASVNIPADFKTETAVPHKVGIVLKKEGNRTDRSRADFNEACKLIRQGKTDLQILERLTEFSDKAGGRKSGERYLIRTIDNARKLLIISELR